jgi:hypothetical protein
VISVRLGLYCMRTVQFVQYNAAVQAKVFRHIIVRKCTIFHLCAKLVLYLAETIRRKLNYTARRDLA